MQFISFHFNSTQLKTIRSISDLSQATHDQHEKQNAQTSNNQVQPPNTLILLQLHSPQGLRFQARPSHLDVHVHVAEHPVLHVGLIVDEHGLIPQSGHARRQLVDHFILVPHGLRCKTLPLSRTTRTNTRTTVGISHVQQISGIAGIATRAVKGGDSADLFLEVVDEANPSLDIGGIDESAVPHGHETRLEPREAALHGALLVVPRGGVGLVVPVLGRGAELRCCTGYACVFIVPCRDRCHAEIVD
jgi:hypothetical protein